MSEINWYPGHMAKTRRMLEEKLRAADAVIELCDARAPLATRNPDLDGMCRGKARILVVNKADLADDNETARWIRAFADRGLSCVKFTATRGDKKTILSLIETACAPAVERMRMRGANKTVRVVIVGIPNVGKSAFVNRMLGRPAAVVGDRPGVTRAEKWVRLTPLLEMMDSPGMLWPKLNDQNAARTLAFLGSIRDEITDREGLAESLLGKLIDIAPDATNARFKLAQEGDTLLERACRGRGWLLSGGRCDTERGAGVVLDEFRAGKLGKLTLERA